MNRRGFDQDAQVFLDNHSSLILIDVDINDFKLFNDIYGHHIGDQLLIALADDFRQFVPAGDLLCRSGSDEFTLIIANPSKVWMKKAYDFFNGVHSFNFENVLYTYTLSAGFSSYPDQTKDLSALTRMADTALYHAKMIAKEKFWKYAPDMDYDFRYSLGFNAKNLSESSPAAMLIYKADAQRKILFLNQLCAELFGYDSINDMLQTSASFTAFVDAASCNTIDSYLQDDSSFQYPELHIQCKDGSSKEVFCTGRLSENEHFGSICFCFLLQM